MAVGLAARQRGAAVQWAQPLVGLRTVWVRLRVGLRAGLWPRPVVALRVQRAAERAGDESGAWADTQPAMFWGPLHTTPEKA